MLFRSGKRVDPRRAGISATKSGGSGELTIERAVRERPVADERRSWLLVHAQAARFVPAQKQGNHVKSRVLLRVNFLCGDTEAPAR